MILVVFWVAVAVIAYTFVVFPLLVGVRALVRPRPPRSADITPRVSMIVAAYNEARSIADKLENALALDYPADCLEVIVASDGSTDGTDAIVRRYAGDRVRLVSLPRGGKAAALNAAVSVAGGDILVFSDANSMYRSDAVRALVRPFADAAVGGVAGNQVYTSDDGGGGGERAYWALDRVLKHTQSRAASVVSATGAIYAIRRALYRPIPTGVMDDFFVSTSVVAAGYRLVFAPDAIAIEPAATSSALEFERKVRNTTLGLEAVLANRRLLNPFRYGFYSVQLFSHKVLRRLAVFPVLVVAAVSPFLWSHGLVYQAATAAQSLFYGLALGGYVTRRTSLGQSKLLALPFFFCMVYAACVVAALRVARRRRITSWETQRQREAPPAPAASPALRETQP